MLKLRAGVDVAVATLVVKNGAPVPALKLVTVPVPEEWHAPSAAMNSVPEHPLNRLTMLAAVTLKRAKGTVPACKVPVMSTCHSEAPASDLKFMKLPVGDVSVNLDPLTISVPFALWPASSRSGWSDSVTTPEALTALIWRVVPAITVAPPQVPHWTMPPTKHSS